jgi:hypothetical protein
MGPVVTREAQQRILGLIDSGESQGASAMAACAVATRGERPTRVIVLGLAGLAVGAAQLAGDGLAGAALDLGYPLALGVLAVLEAVGCVQLLLAVRHAGRPLG